jgi:hypothetical protein
MVSGKIRAVGSTNPRVRLLGRCPFFGGGLRTSHVMRTNFGRRDLISGYGRPNHGSTSTLKSPSFLATGERTGHQPTATFIRNTLLASD